MSSKSVITSNACYVCKKTKKNHPGLSLHKFPTNSTQKSLWLKACGMTQNEYQPSSKICSSHFKRNCLNKMYDRTCLKPGSVPTKFAKKQSGLDTSKGEQKNKKKEEEPSEEQPFCPKTMFRCDKPIDDYNLYWVCKLCNKFLFSKNAVLNHLTLCNDANHEQNESNDETSNESSYDSNDESSWSGANCTPSSSSS